MYQRGVREALQFKPMKRRLLILIALVIVLSALAVRSSVRAMARRKREIGYEAALRTYSAAFHPGITRKELEDRLRSSNTHFSWTSTAYGGRTETQYADLVKIGEENAPWYCSEEYVYVAFEFTGVAINEQNDSDVLERIEIFRPDSGCL